MPSDANLVQGSSKPLLKIGSELYSTKLTTIGWTFDPVRFTAVAPAKEHSPR